MKKYLVDFTEVLTVREAKLVVVYAESEEQAKQQVEDGLYDIVDIYDSEVLDVESFEVNKVTSDDNQG